MRVIAGSARGTKLHCPDGLSVRPTHDRIKEAVFSMLTDKVRGARVLDLFAGTGALGIEALSRGAKHCTFVDASPLSLKTVESNLEKTHLSQQARLASGDYLSFLTGTKSCYDLIFLDPPYRKGYLPAALHAISQYNLLAPGGIIFCEMDAKAPEELGKHFSTLREKIYGRVQVFLLKEL